MFFLKAFLFAICLLGGFSIAGYLRVTGAWPWIPYAGGLLGLIGAVLILEVEKQIKKAPLSSSLGGATGLILGLVIGRLLMFPFECFRNEAFLHYFILLSLSGIFGYLGLALGRSKAGEIGKFTASALIPPTFSKTFPVICWIPVYY